MPELPSASISNASPAPRSPGFARQWGADSRGGLFHPAVDFMLVGGGSLLFFLVLIAFFPAVTPSAAVSLIAFNIAYVVNDPHFAMSYVLMYSDLPRILRDPATSRGTKIRYLWASIFAPALLIAYCAYGFLTGNLLMLSFLVNAMFFFVGWHYIKQGYGVLIVFSVLNKYYYTNLEKIILRGNLYIVWAATWLMVNDSLQSTEFYGITIYNVALRLGITPAMTNMAFGAAIISSIFALGVFVNRYLRDGRLPSINGVVGYVMSSYGWLMLVLYNPLFLLFTPAFHSMQYLSLVMKYQYNAAGANGASGALLKRIFTSKRLLRFIVVGLALAYAMFHFIPDLLQKSIPYDQAVLGTNIFFFMVIAFINIHHYFIDNVIWRKDNPQVRQHLFAPAAKKA